MLNLQQISDRLEIRQLMIAYATALDTRNFDAWDDVFTPDAYIDYRATGGIDGRYPDVKIWIKKVMTSFPNYYHMLGNMDIDIRGDAATGRTICFNPTALKSSQGEPQVMFIGLWYVDKFVRTAAGWRINERVEEKCFSHNAPDGLNVG